MRVSMFGAAAWATALLGGAPLTIYAVARRIPSEAVGFANGGSHGPCWDDPWAAGGLLLCLLALIGLVPVSLRAGVTAAVTRRRARLLAKWAAPALAQAGLLLLVGRAMLWLVD